MIKISDVSMVQTEIESNITPQVKTYDISTGFMSDECKPYRVAQSAMIWINEDGYLGEIECIYPIKVDIPQCSYSKELSQINGFPHLEISNCDDDSFIQVFDSGFAIWFAKEKLIDKALFYGNLTFLISENELVAIKAKNASIIE